MEPQATYDRPARVLTVGFEEGSIAETVPFDEDHLVDLDENGRALGIEVLTPDDPKVEEMAAAFGFVDRVPAILTAILNALVAPPEVRTRANWIDVSSSVKMDVVLGPSEWKTASASGAMRFRKPDPVS